MNSSSRQKLSNASPGRLKVYYDGLCKVCSQEMHHYMKQTGAEDIEFIDICSTQFDAQKEKLDPVQIHKVMHVRRPDQTIATRVQAFIEIWSVLPKYKFLAQIAKNPIVRAGLEAGYSGFAAIRPLLPRYKDRSLCQDSPYCEVRDAKSSP